MHPDSIRTAIDAKKFMEMCGACGWDWGSHRAKDDRCPVFLGKSGWFWTPDETFFKPTGVYRQKREAQ